MTSLLAQVEHDEIAVDRRAAPDLLARRSGVRAVELDALGDVRGGQHLVGAQLRARVDQLHHQLVVGDAEVAEAAEAGARVHQEREEDPAGGIEDLALGEAGGVGLVDRLHQLLGDAREARRAAEVVVHDTRGRHRLGADHVVGGGLVEPVDLRVVVIEREVDARHVRQVRRDVAVGQLDLAVLHVLGVDEEDVVEHAELLEERRAHQSVEIGARHQPVALHLPRRDRRRHVLDIGSGPPILNEPDVR